MEEAEPLYTNRCDRYGVSISIKYNFCGHCVEHYPDDLIEIHTAEQIEPVATFTVCKTYGGDWNVRENTAVAYIKTKEPAVATREEIEASAGDGVFTYIPDTHRCNPPTFPYPPIGATWQCMALNDAEDFCRKEWILGNDHAWRGQPDSPMIFRPDWISSEAKVAPDNSWVEIVSRADKALKYTNFHIAAMLLTILSYLLVIGIPVAAYMLSNPFIFIFMLPALPAVAIFQAEWGGEAKSRSTRIARHQEWLSETLKKPLPPTGRAAASFTDYDG